jgi:hypothetical protein
MWIMNPASRLSGISNHKKNESQEEGGGHGFRGIGFHRNQLFDDSTFLDFCLRNNQVYAVIYTNKTLYLFQ